MIVKTVGSGPGEALQRPTCAWGRPGAIHGVTPTGSLALARGSNEDKGKTCALLDISVKIPESSTGVCISLSYSLASAFTLFA